MTIAMTRRAVLATGLAAAAEPIRIARAEGATVTPTTKGLSPTEKMQRVLKAWELAAELNNDYPVRAASLEMIAEAEKQLGYSLSESMRALYLAHDGGWYLGGNIVLEPLFPKEEEGLSVTSGVGQLRAWDWPLPDDVLVVGGDGGDGTHGLWISDFAGREPIVVETVDAGESFAVVGDDLASFLVGRSAYYLLLYSDYFDPERALDVLEVPNDLRRTDFDDEHYYAVRAWANPNLPDIDPESNDVWWTPDQVREFVANRERGGS
jgi:hypothetical protein